MERALRGRGRRGGGSGAPAETLDVHPTLMAGGGRFTWNRVDLQKRVDCGEEREAREQQRDCKNRGFDFHRSLLVTEVLKSGERSLNIGEIEGERFGAGMDAAGEAADRDVGEGPLLAVVQRERQRRKFLMRS